MNQEPEVKSKKSKILFGLFIVFLVMAIGYLPLAFKAKFGTIDQTKDWSIESNIKEATNIEGAATEKYKPYTIGNTIYFGVILKQPGDYIDYEILIDNTGNLDARLEQILISIDNQENTKNAIRYTVKGMQKNDILKAGERKIIDLKVEWNPEIQEKIDTANSSMVVNLQFVQS